MCVCVCRELTKPDLCATDSATLLDLFGFEQSVFQHSRHLIQEDPWNKHKELSELANSSCSLKVQ